MPLFVSAFDPSARPSSLMTARDALLFDDSVRSLIAARDIADCRRRLR
jgi:hypothetical protein